MNCAASFTILKGRAPANNRHVRAQQQRPREAACGPRLASSERHSLGAKRSYIQAVQMRVGPPALGFVCRWGVVKGLVLTQELLR